MNIMEVQFNKCILIAKGILYFFCGCFEKWAEKFLCEFKKICGVSDTAKNEFHSLLETDKL